VHMYMYHKQPPPPVIKGGRNVAEIVSHFLKNPLRGKYIENYKISLKYINIVLYSWKVLLFNLGIVKVLHPSKNKKKDIRRNMDKKMIFSFLLLNAILQTMAGSNALPGGPPPPPRNHNNDNSESSESLQDRASGKTYKPLKEAAADIGMLCREVNCVASECYNRVQHRKFAACMDLVRNYTAIPYDNAKIQKFVDSWFPDNKGLKSGQQMQVLLQNLDYNNNTIAEKNVAFKNNTHADDDGDVITDVSIVETTTISSSIEANASSMLLLMPKTNKTLVANNTLHNHTADALYKFHHNDTLAQNVQIEPLSFELNVVDIQNLNDSKINLLPNNNANNSLDQKIKHKMPQHLKKDDHNNNVNATTSTSRKNQPTTPIMEPTENNEILIENLNSRGTTVNVPTTPSTISTSTSTSTPESTVTATSPITTTTTEPSIISASSTSISPTESTVDASQIAATTQLPTTPIQSTTTELITTSTKPPSPKPTTTTTTTKPHTDTTTVTTSTTIKPKTTRTTLPKTTKTTTTRQPSNIAKITTPIPATTLSETVTASYNIIDTAAATSTSTEATTTTVTAASSTTLHIEKNKISNSTAATTTTTRKPTTRKPTTRKPTKKTQYTNKRKSTMRPIIKNTTPSNEQVDNNNIQRTASTRQLKPIRHSQQYESHHLMTNTTDSKFKNKLHIYHDSYNVHNNKTKNN